MPIELDHIVLAVNERARSLAFYTGIVGLRHEGEDGPFSVLRVTPSFVILVSPHGTKGGEHLAFAMPKQEFDDLYARLKSAGIPYGGSFDSVGSTSGPGNEFGARGVGPSLYFFDPDRHLLEIRHYETA